MRILFIGNSITKGEIGKSFVDLFKNQYPEWTIRNAGVNGDTLKNISDRIEGELDAGVDYDFIVVEAGYNDIILQFLQTKGFLYRLGSRYLYRKGRKPVTIEKFHVKYRQMIHFIQSKCNAKIVLTTLGCINENLSADVNSKRNAYNHSILQVARDHNCLVADISSEMEAVLQAGSQTNYLLENLLNSVYFDKKKCRSNEGADKLSRQRNLLLTIDGVHLNSAGAMIYKEAIEKLITTE